MHEIKLPQLGQSVEEASIVKWLKSEGDAVKEGDLLFSVQTDKAEIDCESTATGVLRKILIEPDVFVPVMTVVALVGDAKEAMPDLSQYGAEPAAAPAPAPEAKPEPTPAPAPAATAAAAPAAPAASGGRAPVSPRAMAKAAELGIDPTTLSGSGVGGRVMEEDVIAASQAGGAVRATPVARRVAEQAGVDLASVAGSGPRGKVMKDDVRQAAAPPAPAQAPAPPMAASGEVERIPLSPMRKVIAQRMVESLFSAPHYFVTMEIDMAAAMKFRKESAGFKPSFNDIVMYSAAKAIRQHPLVNARWAGDAIEIPGDINLGFAVALPAGLIVPVVRQVQNLSLEGLSAESARLVEKARNGKLTPDDYSGSTFTVSNLGASGVDQFTAIINQPNSAILAVGRIKDKVVVIDGGMHIRPMMNITLSSDHRVIDGAVAAQFMATLRKILETAQF
jgi:pyruvate dehydrogenase E2 component (dihydrolipoamide acetyltransferase)